VNEELKTARREHRKGQMNNSDGRSSFWSGTCEMQNRDHHQAA
jgi:hypothetical protein